MGQEHLEAQGNPVQKGDTGKTLEPKIELYFGLFFDGTNNNKIQVMLGKRYRRGQYIKEIAEKSKDRKYSHKQILFLLKSGILENFTVEYYTYIPSESDYPKTIKIISSKVVYTKNNINELTESIYDSIQKSPSSTVGCSCGYSENGNSLVQQGRSVWNQDNAKGILNQSQLDNLFFGYDENNPDKYFIEKRISEQLNNQHNGDKSSNNIGWDKSEKTEHFTFASADAETNQRIKAEADSFANEDGQKKRTNYSSPSQSPTYTNIVILESLYDASLAQNKSNDDITRKYYSIYVEGSGSDMKFYPPVFGHMHLMGPGVFGLGKGTGDSGAVAKVMKMARQVKNIISGFSNPKKLFFDIFGFSRGATEARMFNYLLNPQKNAEIGDKLKKVNKNRINDYKLFTGNENEYLKDLNILEKKVRFLGIYDTVSSIGVFREGWLTSTIKRAAINGVGSIGEILDFRYNQIPEFLSQVGDKASAMFVRLLYEKTINHPTQLANAILTGFSPDFFIYNHQLGTEDLLNYILAKFPFDKLPVIQDTKPIIEALRDGIKSIRENFVEKYEDYVNEKHLECMEEPDVSIFGKSKYHDENVDDYGLYATNQAEEVFHICALDEVRSNFALVDIESSVFSNGLELFLPGCHTDIGGGTGLGRDDQKIANISAANGTPNFVCKTKPFDKKSMEYVPMSTEGLMLAGWIDTFDYKAKGSYLRNVPTDQDLETEGTVYSDNADSWINTPNIIMNRYVQPGYSNIGLHLMQERANGKGRSMFKNIPKSYQVPKDLKEGYYDIILSKIKGLPNGRVFVNPTSGKYRELRHEWIHYSANEDSSLLSLGTGVLVNAPNNVGAFLNNRKNTILEDTLILKGEDVCFEKQEHPIMKMGHNISKVLTNPRTYLFSFPFNASTPMQVFTMTDAMLASRIIYRGRKKEELSSLNVDTSKPNYMFDYLQAGKLIGVSLKNKNNELYLRDLIAILEVEKERAQHFIEMCRDIQGALGKIKNEELFHIRNNALRLINNNSYSISKKITIPISTNTGMAMIVVSPIIETNDPNRNLEQNVKIGLLKGFKTSITGHLQLNDIIAPIMEKGFEEERKRKGYSPEASDVFTNRWAYIRDHFTASIPADIISGIEKSHWSVLILLNAPEIGKLFGHTAGLIHVFNKVSDWKKQEEFGHIKERVLTEQIEMIKKDLDS